MRSELDKSRRDVAIARLAANQHGVVTTAQLNDAGLSRGRIAERAKAGRLHPLHRGVYAVGHRRLSNEGRWMAAVLACGDGAVLSHLSAAELWRIRHRTRRPSGVGGFGEAVDVHVTVPKTNGMSRRHGIALHRSSVLTPNHRTRRDGIPVTTPSRTLRDLRPLLSPAQFAAALREAEFLGLPLDQPLEDDRARTDLEQRMLAICRRHRLPRPEVNAKIDRFEVDFLWRGPRVIVEVDGWDAHRTRSAFEEDRARDVRLAMRGFAVVRFTWRQLTRDPPGVAKTIRALIRESAA